MSQIDQEPALARRPPSPSAADAVRALGRLVAIATQLLLAPADAVESADQGPESALASQRVARLRNELHVTANRVARFRFEARPTVDVVHIPPTTAAGALLAPRVVLYRLGLTVDRLVGLIGRLPAEDWERVARVGDRQATLGAMVDEALQMGFELLGPSGHPRHVRIVASSGATGEPSVRMGQDRRRELSGLPDGA